MLHLSYLTLRFLALGRAIWRLDMAADHARCHAAGGAALCGSVHGGGVIPVLFDFTRKRFVQLG